MRYFVLFEISTFENRAFSHFLNSNHGKNENYFKGTSCDKFFGSLDFYQHFKTIKKSVESP
jgi:hypothetical protein